MSSHPFDLGEALPTIEAGRVRLRWLDDDDVPALYAIFSDREVTRYFGFGVLLDQAAAAALLAQIQEGFRSRTLYQWGIESAEGTLVGTCTLAQLDAVHRRAELGFALGRAHWGKGHISDALPPLLDFAFDRLDLHRLVADSDPRNLASLRVLARLGFRREGHLREHYSAEGERQDAIVFGLLRREWKRARREGQ